VRNLVYKNQKVPTKVVSLRKQLKLYIPLNTQPIKLLTPTKVEQINKYLNSPIRAQEKRQSLYKDEKTLNVHGYSETVSEDWQLLYEQTRDSTEKKTG